MFLALCDLAWPRGCVSRGRTPCWLFIYAPRPISVRDQIRASYHSSLKPFGRATCAIKENIRIAQRKNKGRIQNLDSACAGQLKSGPLYIKGLPRTPAHAYSYIDSKLTILTDHNKIIYWKMHIYGGHLDFTHLEPQNLFHRHPIGETFQTKQTARL